MFEDFEKDMAIFGSLVVNGEEVVDGVHCELSWTEPSPSRFLGRASFEYHPDIEQRLRTAHCFSVLGTAVNGRDTQVKFGFLSEFRRPRPGDYEGRQWAVAYFEAEQVELRPRSSKIPACARPSVSNRLTLRLELGPPGYSKPSSTKGRLPYEIENPTLPALARYTTGSENRPQPAKLTDLGVSIYCEHQTRTSLTVVHGLYGNARVTSPVLHLEAPLEADINIQDQIRRLEGIGRDCVALAAFLDRQPPLLIWSRHSSWYGTEEIQEYTTYFASPPRPRGLGYGPIVGHQGAEIFLEMLPELISQKSTWNITEALGSYFTALQSTDAMQRFLNFYLSLEALVSSFAKQSKEQYWLPDSRARKSLKEEVSRTVDEWLRKEGRGETRPNGKVTDLLRRSARSVQSKMFDALGVDTDDLRDSNENELPWVTIRNKVFHTGSIPDGPRLCLVAEQLRCLVERCLLRILNVEGDRAIDSYRPFKPKWSSFEVKVW